MTWRTRGIVALAALLALCGAFGVGRYSRPAPAVQDQRTVTAAVSASSATEAHAVEATKEVADTKADTTRHVITRWLPAVPAAGGCPAIPAHVEQEATEETHAATTRTAEGHKVSRLAEAHQEQAQQTTVELHTVEPSPPPSWSVALLVGRQLAGAAALELPEKAAATVLVDHRLAGPVSAGVWASTSGAVGAALRVDW